MTDHKRVHAVATFRLPRESDSTVRERAAIVHLVWECALSLPRRVIAVRDEGSRGLLFVSRNTDWCFETTRTEPAAWMVTVCRQVLRADGVRDSSPFVTTVGHVAGQQELDLRGRA